MPYSFPCLGGINGDVRVAMPEEGAGSEEEETQRELTISPETGKQSINPLLFFSDMSLVGLKCSIIFF